MPGISTLFEKANGLFEQAIALWLSGGWAMIAIAATALALFSLGVHVHLALSRKSFRSVPESTWRRWIEHPEERKGWMGGILDYVTSGATVQETSLLFEQLHKTEVAPMNRDLLVMRICVTAAPLFGLLGTVTGMLATFDALAVGSGGEKTMGLVAEGISEALITTETGLVIALPGLFFQYQLIRRLEGFKVFLGHLEGVCMQALHRGLRIRRAAS